MSMRAALAGALLAIAPNAAPARDMRAGEAMPASILFLDLHGATPFQFWIDDRLVFDGKFPADSPSTGLTATLHRDVAAGSHRFRLRAGMLDVTRRLDIDGKHHIVVVSKVPGREIEMTDQMMLD
ncbi:MAG: hypothetical protein IIZ38_03510 [Sphingomonas sp.]|uniref:hypothetical protein n=1 Tax=Sphingomonas sp. TaxID=28214 RepID=UPI0025D79434|nr:hypothetical protein [Sphingomonas sp.]MBQ1497360.1 hypothetical protein [Sphingomonas sp.]